MLLELKKTDIFQSGTATTFYDADAVNNILGCGYINHCIDSFKREYKEKEVGGEK